MHLMASTFLVLLAVVGVIIFVTNMETVGSSLLVPVTTPTTMRTTTVKPFNCKRMLLSMGKKVFKQFGICNRDMKVFIPSEKEREKKLNCAVKCVLKKMKFVNEKDLVTMAGVDEFLNTFLPSDFHEAAHIFMDGCVEDIVDKGEAPQKEEQCESYGEFLTCLQGQFTGLC